jgi:hypothetical protein
MDRRFVLPAVSGLALVVSGTGCSSEKKLLGTWSITSYAYDGDIYKLPYEYTYVDDGVTSTERSGLRLEFKKDGRGEWIQYYDYFSSEGDNYSEEYGYAMDWEKGKGRSFDIEVDEADLDMNCTIDGDDMVCEGDLDGADLELDLERLVDEE